MCCGYGTAGVGTMGYDCLVIPGAAKMASPYTLLPYNAFCGQGGLITAAAAANVEATGGKTVCCKFFNSINMFESVRIFAKTYTKRHSALTSIHL